MALSVKSGQVESILRKLLPRRGYKLLNKPRTRGETGADIIAQKGDVRVSIECIGSKMGIATQAPETQQEPPSLNYLVISKLFGNH